MQSAEESHMPTLESLTVDQLAALCGLERDGCGTWTDPVGTVYQRRMVAPKAFSTLWNVWPEGTHGQRIEAPNEHAALVALVRHLNVKPPENPVKYKRIDRDPESNDYDGYVPKAGDVWCFHDGQKWPVSGLAPHGLIVGPSAGIANLSPTFLPVRSLTTHIERPVRVIDVRGPGYQPKVGDVLCGPDGAAMTVEMVFNDGSMTISDRAGSRLAVGRFYLFSLVALCTRIEREE